MSSSQFPCPICGQMAFIIGTTSKNKKLGSCGHSWHFKLTRSQKDQARKYIRTEWGLELISKK